MPCGHAGHCESRHTPVPFFPMCNVQSVHVERRRHQTENIYRWQWPSDASPPVETIPGGMIRLRSIALPESCYSVVRGPKTVVAQTAERPFVAEAIGSETRNTVRPGSDSTSIVPQCSSVTMRQTLSNPRPIP